MQVEVVRRDVRHHRHVVVERADPPEEDAAAGGLQHGHVNARLRERAGRPPEPRVVAFLDQPSVEIHPVGRRIGHVSARGQQDVGERPDGGGLPVRSGHGDHRDRRIGHRWRGSGLPRSQPPGRFGQKRVERPSATQDDAEQGGDLAGKRLGQAPAAPREGHDDQVRAGTRTRSDRQVRPRRPRQGPGHMGGQAGHGALTLLAPRRPRADAWPGAPVCIRTLKSGSRRRGYDPPLGCLEPAAHVQRELHGRAREVQVRAVEDPELGQPN